MVEARRQLVSSLGVARDRLPLQIALASPIHRDRLMLQSGTANAIVEALARRRLLVKGEWDEYEIWALGEEAASRITP